MSSISQALPTYQAVPSTIPRDSNFLHIDNTLRHNSCFRFLLRFSNTSIALLLFLLVVDIGCLIFLAFLWGANTDNTVWRSIVLAGWVTRSVTITSLVLRWAMAIQAGTCTSMLAAVLLQRAMVPLPVAAAVSIMRYENKGPWSLLNKMGVQWHCISVGILTVLLTFTTLSLQFTSTVLLSQVGVTSLPVASSVPQLRYGIKLDGSTYNSLSETTPSFLDITPVRYPAFAEWTPNVTSSRAVSSHGVFAWNNTPSIRDTGTVMRAFLPINNDSDRSRLTEYHGFATVVDTRVVCMRPSLTNVEFTIGNGFNLTGLAEIRHRAVGLVRQKNEEKSNNYSLSFSCAFTASTNEKNSEPNWALSLCQGQYENSEQGIFSAMDPKERKQPGNSYLIINATMLENVTEVDNSDVWESITRTNLDRVATWETTVLLQVTLCMTAFQAQHMEVYATRSTANLPETAPFWNVSTAEWNTKAVLNQLGAGGSNLSTEDRGIFNLAPRSWQWPKPPDFPGFTGEAGETTDALIGIGTKPFYSAQLNSVHYSIFSHTVMLTGNPALAIQALFTNLCSICYYDRIPMFDALGPSTQVYLMPVTQPLGWTAFIIVASMATLHMLLVLLVLLMFRRYGNLSQIQNAWASVSQVLGPTTEDWIRGIDRADDRTVKSWLKDRGIHRVLVGVDYNQHRVHLVKKDKTL